MKTKAGVKVHGLQLVMRNALMVASEVYSNYNQELVITSTTDGVHSPGSLHPYGYAFDARTRFFAMEDRPEVANSIRKKLAGISKYYDVVLESTHIHIEFDMLRYLEAKENEKSNTIDNIIMANF